MTKIKFAMGDNNYALYRKAKSDFNSNMVSTLSDAEKIEVFLKMLAIEESDDAETERDLKEKMGWYDEDYNRKRSHRKKKKHKAKDLTSDERAQEKAYLQELSNYIFKKDEGADDLQTIIARRPKSLSAEYVMELVMSETIKYQ